MNAINWNERIESEEAREKRKHLRRKLSDRNADADALAATTWWAGASTRGQHNLPGGGTMKTNFIGGNLQR